MCLGASYNLEVTSLNSGCFRPISQMWGVCEFIPQTPEASVCAVPCSRGWRYVSEQDKGVIASYGAYFYLSETEKNRRQANKQMNSTTNKKMVTDATQD